MNNVRRQTLKVGGLVLVSVAGTMLPLSSAMAQSAWNKAAFDGKSLNDVVKAMGGATAAPSGDISINAPEIAENGAVVPVGVVSKIPNTQSISILVEKNPSALAASFDLPAGADANVTTRVKMGQSSNVHAVVKTADGKYFVATKEVKVTLGGCGG